MKCNQTWKLGLLTVVAAIGLGMTAPRASAGVVLHIGVGVPAPAPVPVVYHYEYYPDAEVYFDPDARAYWWLSDGVWVSGPRVPAGIELGGRVALDVDAREPWHHHEVVVKEYPRHGRDHDHDRDHDRH